MSTPPALPSPPAPHHPDDTAALNMLGAKLGHTMLGMLIHAHGIDAAAVFATSIVVPTAPDTPERVAQDRNRSLLTTMTFELVEPVELGGETGA